MVVIYLFTSVQAVDLNKRRMVTNYLLFHFSEGYWIQRNLDDGYTNVYTLLQKQTLLMKVIVSFKMDQVFSFLTFICII